MKMCRTSYKIIEPIVPHFMTVTTVNWIPIFHWQASEPKQESSSKPMDKLTVAPQDEFFVPTLERRNKRKSEVPMEVSP